MAYIKRPISQGWEFFKPDIYINFRSTNSVNDNTQEVKKWWVFIIWKKNPETGLYESKEVNSIEFYSLMILDKLEWEHERSDLVRNVYWEDLVLRDKKSFKFISKAKWDNDLKKFVDINSTDILTDDFKVKKVIIGQLKDTKEIFTLELGWTQARNLMSKKFSKNNLYNPNWDYKLTSEEEEKQKAVVTLFMDGVDLKLEANKEAVKVWKDKTYKMAYLLNVSGNTDEVTLDEKCLKTIDILEKQLDWKNTNNPVETKVSVEEEISIEDIPF